MIAGQDVAITSPVPGTTTDVVEKTMELLPVGPVVFLDTAGLDDTGVLGPERIRRAKKVFDRADVVVLVAESGVWHENEDEILSEAKKREIPVIVAVNKSDLKKPDAAFTEHLKTAGGWFACASTDAANAARYTDEFKRHLVALCPDEFLNPPPLVGDLLPSGGLAVLVVPIDLQAPKGRLILPQVQTIRDALDNDSMTLVVKERELREALSLLNRKPDLVVCDSQVVLKMTADTPPDVPCTTFSILFARLKGDLVELAKGAAALNSLKKGDRVLIAESCSHHPAEDDIGRVKIPRWLRQFAGADIEVDISAGLDFPPDLSKYKVVIHCGSCMLNRRDMLSRLAKARAAGVPITNYGVAISLLQGVLPRVLGPFPAALQAYKDEAKR